jgi:hypothetical protein
MSTKLTKFYALFIINFLLVLSGILIAQNKIDNKALINNPILSSVKEMTLAKSSILPSFQQNIILKMLNQREHNYIHFKMNSKSLKQSIAVYKTSTSTTYMWMINDWKTNSRTTYTYDNKGNNTETLTETSLMGGPWQNSSKTTSKFDSKGNETEMVLQGWINNAWENDTKYSYTYNTANLQTESITQNWTSGQWVNSSRTTDSYNASNFPTEEITYEWKNGAWAYHDRTTNKYDQQNNLTEILDEDYINGSWVNTSQQIVTITQQNFISITRKWSNNAWVNYQRTTGTYSGNILNEYVVEEWSNGNWVNNSRMTYNYNANGKASSLTIYTWKNNAWESSIKTTYTYDSNLNLTEEVVQMYSGGTWTNVTKTVYTYVNVTEVRLTNPEIPGNYGLNQNYPNPFNPSTTIGYIIPENAYVKIKVYNSLGQEIETLVSKQQAAGQYTIEWEPNRRSGLPGGVYMYRIQAGKYVEVKKMVYMK